jgi:hypothetical protein
MKFFSNLFFPMQYVFTVAAITFFVTHAFVTPVNAQTAPGVLPASPAIETLVSIDAHNILIIGTRDENAPGAQTEYSQVAPRHIYSGGVVRVFGGVVMPAESFVIPESAWRSGLGARNFGVPYAPRVPVQSLSQFSRILGFLDRPIPQAQITVE